MGRNIIDEFFVTFGLDPSDYRKGEREVRKSFKDTRESAKSTFDDIETRGKGAGSVFRSLRNEVAGLILVFAGARSIVDFAGNMLTSEANASRLGETIGMNTGRVIAWEKALKSVGGTAGEADASLKSIQDAMYKFKLTGQVDPGFQALGITPGDLDPDSSTPEDVLLKLARNKNGFNSKEFAQRLAWLGVSQNTIYLMEQYKGRLRDVIDQQEKMANVSQADADAAKRLQTDLTNLQTRIEGGARPALTGMVETMLNLDDRFDLANKAVPIFEGVLGAAAITAGLAYWPFFALAGVLAMIAKGFDGSAESAKKWAESRRFWEQIKAGDFRGAANTFLEGVDEDLGTNLSKPRRDPLTGPTNLGMSVPGRSSSASANNYIEDYLRANGFTAEQARGIRAGITAEGGGLGMAKNGAFGIGQWRGSRQRELFSRYGSAPSLADQLAFLVSELKGGDAGGASVRSQSSAYDTMVAYLRDFMRPQGKNWEHARDLYADIGRGRRALGQTVNIGSITVNTQATDGQAVARDLSAALRARGIVAQANTGLTP